MNHTSDSETARALDSARSTWSVRNTQGKRSLFLCAAGALLGLILAGVSLFTAKGTRTSGVPVEAVALVNGVPLLMSDYVEQLRATFDVSRTEASPKQKRQILHDMIREEVYVQRGIELGFPTDITEVRSALVGAVEAQATIDASVIPPSEPAIRAFYQQHRDEYAKEGTMTLTDYVSPAPVNSSVIAALRSSGGEPTEAARLGLKSSGAVDDGQEFYFAAQLHLGETLFGVARSLHANQVSQPIEVGGQTHILVMHQNDPPVTAALEAVIDRVIHDFTANEAKRLQQRTEKFLLERADVRTQPGIE
jgi:hypothetical protein